MFRDQHIQQLGFVRFVEIAAAGRAFRLCATEFCGGIDGEQLFDDHTLLNGRLEFVVDNVQFVEGALREVVRQITADIDGMFEAELVEDTGPFLTDVPGPTAEIVTPFAADNAQVDLKPTALTLPDKL